MIYLGESVSQFYRLNDPRSSLHHCFHSIKLHLSFMEKFEREEKKRLWKLFHRALPSSSCRGFEIRKISRLIQTRQRRKQEESDFTEEVYLAIIHDFVCKREAQNPATMTLPVRKIKWLKNGKIAKGFSSFSFNFSVYILYVLSFKV